MKFRSTCKTTIHNKAVKYIKSHSREYNSVLNDKNIIFFDFSIQYRVGIKKAKHVNDMFELFMSDTRMLKGKTKLHYREIMLSIAMNVTKNSFNGYNTKLPCDNKSYKNLKYGRIKFMKILDWMEKNDYIVKYKGYFISNNNSATSVILGTKKLYDGMSDEFLDCCGVSFSDIKMKYNNDDGDIESISIYGETINDNLETINRHMIKYDVYMLERIMTTNLIARRFCRGNLTSGGRFYKSTVLTVQSKNRKNIFIDGSPTCELDYNCLHINMLYNKIGEVYDGDAYDLDGMIPTKFNVFDEYTIRPIIKKALNSMINARDRKSCIKSILQNISYNYPKHFKVCDVIDIMNVISKKHNRISNNFCSDIGVELQFSDSEMAETILLTCVDINKPCISIHDSFIMKQEDKNLLEHLMLNTYYNKFGFNIKVK